MNGTYEPKRNIYNAIWALRNKQGFHKAVPHRIAEHRRNVARNKHSEQFRPDRCHALVDKHGTPHMYMMMTHDEAKEKNKQAVLIGLRWTIGEAPSGEKVKTK